MTLADVSIHAWLLENKIRTETGKEYDLASHMFWFDILSDESPRQVWLKAAQVGGSLMANLKLFWIVRNRRMNVIYTLPTADDVKTFVGGKTNPLISQNPILREWVKDKDTIEQKRVGDNTIYFRGTWTDRAALSVSSDLNVYDEEDRSKRSVIEQYASRLQHSPHKWEWHFSNPSTEGNGVSQYWNRSDKRHWFVTCSACSKKQYLSWPDSIDPERRVFQCKGCKAELTDRDRSRGSWHAMKTDYEPDYRGYWISLLMCPWVTAGTIIDLHRTKTAEYFHNFVLGLPYSGGGGKVTEQQFFANLSEDPYLPGERIVIGVDTGLPNWYVAGSASGLFLAGKCDGYAEIRAMLDRWPRAVAVIDQGGDLVAPRELQEAYPGRVFLCYYRADRKAMTLVDWGSGAEAGKVVADRNRVIQMTMDELRTRRIPLRGTREDWEPMWNHLSNMYRVVEEGADGNERFVWERSGPDHLCHAMFYWRIGMERFGLNGPTHVTAKGDYPPGIDRSYELDPTNPGIPAGHRISEEAEDWRTV